MADKSHLDLLLRGFKAWFDWRRENPEIRPDHTKAQLKAAQLTPLWDLSYADLSGADLERTDFSSSNLVGANLSGANLSHAILHDTHLPQLNLPLQISLMPTS